MAGFKPLNAKASVGNVIEIPVEASASIVKGDALGFDGGYAELATSSTAEIRYVAMADADNSAGSDGDINVLALDVCGVRFECETNSTAAQTHVGTFVDLTDANTINEAASTTNVFFVDTFVSTGILRGKFTEIVS